MRQTDTVIELNDISQNSSRISHLEYLSDRKDYCCTLLYAQLPFISIFNIFSKHKVLRSLSSNVREKLQYKTSHIKDS